jgi:hypothetical protein
LRNVYPTIAAINDLATNFGAHRPTCHLMTRSVEAGSAEATLWPGRVGKRLEMAICKVEACGWTGEAGTGAVVYASMLGHAYDTLLDFQEFPREYVTTLSVEEIATPIEAKTPVEVTEADLVTA